MQTHVPYTQPESFTNLVVCMEHAMGILRQMHTSHFHCVHTTLTKRNIASSCTYVTLFHTKDGGKNPCLYPILYICVYVGSVGSNDGILKI